jgi:rubrerythrin
MMSITLSGSELIDIAIGIERKGIAFYDIMAKSTENASARDVFQDLANMEREHIHLFQSMLAEADKYQIPVNYTKEYNSYIQALIDSDVFSDDMVMSEMATQADSDIEALELAIGAEKDSILFYYEIKEIIPKRAQAIVNKIITEEKAHLKQLSELKRTIATQ